MDMSTQIRTGRHCVFNLHAHLVFVAKYRKNIFSAKIIEKLKTMFSKVCKDMEVTLKEVNGERDHIHLLVEYQPKLALSVLVNSLKGVSSRKLKEYFPELKEFYIGKALWSPSYFAASCGGVPLEIVKRYIEQQKQPVYPP